MDKGKTKKEAEKIYNDTLNTIIKEKSNKKDISKTLYRFYLNHPEEVENLPEEYQIMINDEITERMKEKDKNKKYKFSYIIDNYYNDI